MKTESYPRLRQAYAIIDGIPDERFNLSQIANSDDPNHCGTIACAAGWLAMHPGFETLKLTPVCSNFFYAEGEGGGNWWGEMANIFGISETCADLLFQCRRHHEYEPKGAKGMTDKQLWQARVHEFLDSHPA